MLQSFYIISKLVAAEFRSGSAEECVEHSSKTMFLGMCRVMSIIFLEKQQAMDMRRKYSLTKGMLELDPISGWCELNSLWPELFSGNFLRPFLSQPWQRHFLLNFAGTGRVRHSQENALLSASQQGGDGLAQGFLLLEGNSMPPALRADTSHDGLLRARLGVVRL